MELYCNFAFYIFMSRLYTLMKSTINNIFTQKLIPMLKVALLKSNFYSSYPDLKFVKSKKWNQIINSVPVSKYHPDIFIKLL